MAMTVLTTIQRRACVCECVRLGHHVPAHSSTVSTVHQEYWPESSGHSHVRRLSDENHYGLHELQQQHTRLHGDKRQHEQHTETEAGSEPSESICHVWLTFTMVLLCRMKVWKPNQRIFMHSSNATITRASSSRVAWTWRGVTHRRVYSKLCVDPLCLVVYVFTNVNIQAQRGHGGSFTQRQHHQHQACQQLHHVEQVVVCKQVRCQGLRVPRVREELVIVLSFLCETFTTRARHILSRRIWNVMGFGDWTHVSPLCSNGMKRQSNLTSRGQRTFGRIVLSSWGVKIIRKISSRVEKFMWTPSRVGTTKYFGDSSCWRLRL